MKKIVIIGGCAAGPKVAAKCRRMNKENEIHLYTNENIVSYSACGLPYYIEGIVPKIENLIIRTPEEFRETGVNVYLDHTCTKIIPDEKAVIINNEKIKYDELVLCTGARAKDIKIEGGHLKNVFKLRTIQDGIAIREKMKTAKSAVIIGGGYIGIEILEALIANNIKVEMLEAGNQILSNFDKDIAKIIQNHIHKKDGDKVVIRENTKVEKIVGKDEFVGIITDSGEVIEADFCIIATGVTPNSEIAHEAGIELGRSGAIRVNNRMQTNIEHIWAAGDCCEKHCLITKVPMYISLGSIANKEGRACAINVSGGDEKFEGILCSFVTRYFDFTISTTGLTEEHALEYSKFIDIEPIAATVKKHDRAGYMPNTNEITLKLVADKRTGEVLGAQAVGKGDADKRINIATSAIKSKMTIDELINLDLTYAPSFGTPIDPLLEAAYKLKKIIDNKRHN